MELVGEARASKSRALLCKLLERHNTLRVEEEALRAQEGAIQTAQKQVQELQTVVQGRRCYGEEELKTELIHVLNSKKRIIRAHQDSSGLITDPSDPSEYRGPCRERPPPFSVRQGPGQTCPEAVGH